MAARRPEKLLSHGPGVAGKAVTEGSRRVPRQKTLGQSRNGNCFVFQEGLKSLEEPPPFLHAWPTSGAILFIFSRAYAPGHAVSAAAPTARTHAHPGLSAAITDYARLLTVRDQRLYFAAQRTAGGVRASSLPLLMCLASALRLPTQHLTVHPIAPRPRACTALSQRCPHTCAASASPPVTRRLPAFPFRCRVQGMLVIGILKTGLKNLFIRTPEANLREMRPVCVLDFYVHESCQARPPVAI